MNIYKLYHKYDQNAAGKTRFACGISFCSVVILELQITAYKICDFSYAIRKKKEGYRMEKRKDVECAVGERRDEEEVVKDYHTEDYDYLTNSATGMDCTGLMYRTPSNEAEMEAYQDVYQYLPPNVKLDSLDGKNSHK